MATLIGDGSHGRDIAPSFKKENPDFQWIPHHSKWNGDLDVLIAVNDPRLRASIAEELGVQDRCWVHQNAIWADDVKIGYGTHVQYAVSMVRTRIGHHCTISPGVTICGDVTIGDLCLIGAGATICDRVTIGNNVTIGAGAVVLPETIIPDNETWFGVPARVHR